MQKIQLRNVWPRANAELKNIDNKEAAIPKDCNLVKKLRFESALLAG